MWLRSKVKILRIIRELFAPISRKMRKSSTGYVAIMVAVAIPVCLYFVNYLISKTHLMEKTLTEQSALYRAGKAVLTVYNPAHTWDNQREAVYAAAASALNESAYSESDRMMLMAESVPIYKASIQENYPAYKFVQRLSPEGMDYNGFTGEKSNGDMLDRVGHELIAGVEADPSGNQYALDGGVSCKLHYYSTKPGGENVGAYQVFAEEKNKLNLQLDAPQNRFICDSAQLAKMTHDKRTAYIYPARCDVDIILAIPTNHAAFTVNNLTTENAERCGSTNETPIVTIANACADFLRYNFYHTIGVAVGVIPYSAKVSLDPYSKANDWTVPIKEIDQMPDKAYIKQSVAYNTDGVRGGELLNNAYNWGFGYGGTSIMTRQGSPSTYRTITISDDTGLLLSNDPCTTDAYKYQRQHMQPCYLGHCNLMASLCEQTCPVFIPQPYYIYELHDDLEKVTRYLRIMQPFNDTRNKSNFLFLPLHWAANLLSEWAPHPAKKSTAQQVEHPSRASKKKAVVLIVNAPSSFEPRELTYLGFNNDAAEVPMIESDTIGFENEKINPIPQGGSIQGLKGIIKCTAIKGILERPDQQLAPGVYGLAGDQGTVRISMTYKGVVQLKVRPYKLPSVTFYGDNGVTDHATSQSGGRIHLLRGTKKFTFSGPRYIWNMSNRGSSIYAISSTGGMNFGRNLSPKKLKYKLFYSQLTGAILSRQVLRCYAHYGHAGADPLRNKPLILNEDYHADSRNFEGNTGKYFDPCISVNDGYYRKELENNTCRFYATCPVEGGWTWGGQQKPQFAQIKAYNFRPICYGMTRGKFVMSSCGLHPYGDRQIKIATSSDEENWIIANSLADSNQYTVHNITRSAYGDRVQVFTGRCQTKTSRDTSYWTGKHEASATLGFWCLGTSYVGWMFVPISLAALDIVNEDNEKAINLISGCWNCKAKCQEGEVLIAQTCIWNDGWMFLKKNNCRCNRKCITRDDTYYAKHYDLNNFFFVNGDNKTYGGNISSLKDAKLLKNQGIYSLIETKLHDEESGWLCFCGDGQLDLNVTADSEYAEVGINGIKTLNSGASNLYKDGETRSIGEEISIFVLPEQIVNKDSDGNYYFDVTYNNLCFVVADVSNRPYEIVQPTVTMSLESSDSDNKGSTQSTGQENSASKGSTQSVTQGGSGVLDIAENEDGTSTGVVKFVTNAKRSFTVQAMAPITWIPSNSRSNFDQDRGIVSFASNTTKQFKARFDVPELDNTPPTLETNSNSKTKDDTIVLNTPRKLNKCTVEGKNNYREYEEYEYKKYSLKQTSAIILEHEFNKSSGSSISCDPYYDIGSYNYRYGGGNGTINFKNGGRFSNPKLTLYKYMSGSSLCLYGSTFILFQCDKNNCPNRSSLWYSWLGRYNFVHFIHQKTEEIEIDDQTTFRRSIWTFKYATSENSGIVYGYPTEDGTINDYGLVDNYGRKYKPCKYVPNGKVYTSEGSHYISVNHKGCYDELKEEKTSTFTRQFNRYDEVIKGPPKEKNVGTTAKPNLRFDPRYPYAAFAKSISLKADAKEGVDPYPEQCYCRTPYENEVNLRNAKVEGELGSYKYNVFVHAQTADLKVTSYEYTYSSGSFNGITKPAGGYGEYSFSGQTSYSARAENCSVSVATRNNPVGIVGEQTFSQGENANTTTITISPDQYEFVNDGTGKYTVRIECQNVILSKPDVVDKTPFARYKHPDIETEMSGSRVADYHSDPVSVYGNMSVNDVTHTSAEGSWGNNHKYVTIDDLKYWSTHGAGGYNHSFPYKMGTHTDEINRGDFFSTLWDYDSEFPNIRWIVRGEEPGSVVDPDFGKYTTTYVFSGLHRSFYPQNCIDDMCLRFNSDNGYMALVFTGFTLPVNQSLLNNGYQKLSGKCKATLDQAPSIALKQVAIDACKKVSNNARVYVVKYKTDADELDSCTKHVYSADDAKELKQVLHEIAQDIKTYAGGTDAYVQEEKADGPLLGSGPSGSSGGSSGGSSSSSGGSSGGSGGSSSGSSGGSSSSSS